MQNRKKLFLLFTSGLALSAAACTTSDPGARKMIADRIASPAHMVERQIAATPFALTSYERIHGKSDSANIYIEGDGLAWLSRKHKSLDPSPRDPMALRMAAHDKARNVIYIARPCQYSGLLDAKNYCNDDYWGKKRFAPEVIASFSKALDDIKRRYRIRQFNVIGYSGGGAVAALLAAQRDDVKTLRTVAGNLDHEAHSDHHNVSYLDGSLNPTEFSERLANVPQYHFIGGQDNIVPPVILHSYLQSLGSSSCVKYKFIQEASHSEGWLDKWPDLLRENVSCRGPIQSYGIKLPQSSPETPLWDTDIAPKDNPDLSAQRDFTPPSLGAAKP